MFGLVLIVTIIDFVGPAETVLDLPINVAEIMAAVVVVARKLYKDYHGNGVLAVNIR